MEQISMFNSENVKSCITSKAIIEMMQKSDRDIDKIKGKYLLTYYLMSFFDFPYLRIVEGKKKSYLYFHGCIEKILIKNQIQFTKNDADKWFKFQFYNASDIYCISTIFEDLYDLCQSKSPTDGFGCCSQFLECSDAKQCVNNNKWAKGCYYRQNIADGKIFYGKNSTLNRR